MTITNRIKGAWDAFRGYQAIQGEVALADPFRLFPQSDFTPYNPALLVRTKGFRIYDDIRRDEQVKAALAFKKHAVVSGGWTVNPPEDSDDTEMTEFVKQNLKMLQGTIEDSLIEILTGLDYGFSVTERVYIQEGERIVLKALKTRKPHHIEFKQDEFGNVTGIEQEGPAGPIDLPPQKFVLWANSEEFQNPYGISDLNSAYRPWWHKDKAYRWLGMMLERFGIPPLFLMYNPNSFTATSLNDLKTVLSRLQGATSGLLPRKSEGDIEPWIPEVGQQVENAFIPALDKYDTDISRAILMPGLLGLSPDQISGSLARGRVSFDMFMLVVDKLRQEMEESVMNEQVVRQLVDLNWDTQEYPVFKLLPITDDVRLDLLEAWAKLVDSETVTPTIEDEDHIRNILEFPERQEDSELPQDEDDPDEGIDGDDNIEDVEEEEREILASGNDEIKEYREKNQFEKRVNFQEAGTLLAARDFTQELVEILRGSKAVLTTKFTASGVTTTTIRKLQFLPGKTKIDKSFNTNLVDAQQQGIRDLRTEVGKVANFQNEQDPGELLVDAAKFIRTNAGEKSKILQDKILDEVRIALLQGVKQGEGTRALIARLDDVFLPYIGDPTRLRDGLPVSPSNTETIARTETTNAYNSGRLVSSRQEDIDQFMQGMMYSAILDERTTQVCNCLDEKIFRLDDTSLDALTPSNHFNCRSVLVPITVGDEVDERQFITSSQTGRCRGLAQKGFT